MIAADPDRLGEASEGPLAVMVEQARLAVDRLVGALERRARLHQDRLLAETDSGERHPPLGARDQL